MLPNQIKSVIHQLLKPFSLYKRTWLFFCMVFTFLIGLMQISVAAVPDILVVSGNVSAQEGKSLDFIVSANPYLEPVRVVMDSAPQGVNFFRYGDINQDGLFNQLDVNIFYCYVYGCASEDDEFNNFNIGSVEKMIMDQNGSGTIDTEDYPLFMYEYSVFSSILKYQVLWTPGYFDAGNYSIGFKALDPRGNVIESRVVNVTIDNVEKPPTIKDINQQGVVAGKTAMFIIDAQPVGHPATTILEVAPVDFLSKFPTNAKLYRVGDMDLDGDLDPTDEALLNALTSKSVKTPLEKLLGNVDNDQAGAVTKADVLYLGQSRLKLKPAINRFVFYWPTTINFVTEKQVGVSVQNPLNGLSRSRFISINPINEISLSNPINNLYLGVSTKYPTLFQPQVVTSVVNNIVEIESWTGQIRLPSGKIYNLIVEGPTTLSPNGSATLNIKSMGCLQRGNCSEYPELNLESVQNVGLEMVIQYKVKGQSTYKTLKNNIYAFNSRNHRSMYSNIVDPVYLGLPKTTEFNGFKSRVKLNKLSSTYFAVFNFPEQGGYAGVVYNTGSAKFSYNFSIWNSCTTLNATAEDYCFRNGQDYRAQFVSVNSKAGFTMFRRREGNFLDNNFTRIQHTDLWWDINKEYSFQLEVRESRSAFSVVDSETGNLKMINKNNEFWTQYTLSRIEHDASGDVSKDKVVQFGTIAKFGSYKFNGMRSFMEAFGTSLNFEQREMEIVDVKTRVSGETQWRTISPSQILTNADDFTASDYPGASWVDDKGRLHLSAGGQTPYRAE